jgi:hypothetical protein
MVCHRLQYTRDTTRHVIKTSVDRFYKDKDVGRVLGLYRTIKRLVQVVGVLVLHYLILLYSVRIKTVALLVIPLLSFPNHSS